MLHMHLRGAMSLTIPQVCERLHISRSTVLRALHDGALKGAKKHGCGGDCTAPDTCKQGHWEISESSVAEFAAPDGQAVG